MLIRTVTYVPDKIILKFIFRLTIWMSLEARANSHPKSLTPTEKERLMLAKRYRRTCTT